MINYHIAIETYTLLIACQVVKSPPVNAGEVVSVPGSGKKDPLKEKLASHFNILDYKFPWTEEPGGLHGVTKVRDG